MTSGVKIHWQKVWNAVIRDGRMFESSYVSLVLWQKQSVFIREYARGVILDLGAGKLVFRPALEAVSDQYLSLDIVCEHADLDIVGSGECLPLTSSCVDTVFTSQVLEHVLHPWRFIQEVARVLRPGGTLILSVPFMFYIHGGPFDYYRYTPYAVRAMLEENGFVVEYVEAAGGLFSFGAQFVQSPLLAATYLIPILREIGWAINQMLNGVTGVFDRAFGQGDRFPQNVVAVARKPGNLLGEDL